MRNQSTTSGGLASPGYVLTDSCSKNIRTRRLWLTTVKKDTMPLVDDEKVKEKGEAVWEIIKVVATVSVLGKSGAIQRRIAAALLSRIRLVVISVVTDSGMEQLHADNGVDVEYHLKKSS